jgi:hypothetical protein
VHEYRNCKNQNPENERAGERGDVHLMASGGRLQKRYY